MTLRSIPARQRPAATAPRSLAPPPPGELLPGAEDEVNLAELWRTLLRNRWLIVGCTLLFGVLAALYTLRQRPLYNSALTMVFDLDKDANPIASVLPMNAGSQGRLETELVVLRSRQIAEAVVDSLGLSVQLLEPRVPREQVLRLLEVPHDAPRGRYVLEREDAGGYALHVERTRERVALPARVEPGVPFHLGRATLALAPRLTRRPPERIVFDILPFRAAVGNVQRLLSVQRVDPKANALAVSFVSTDPVLAAGVPNVVGATYTAYRVRLSKAESRNTVEFLRAQVGSYERQLLAAENALRGFRERQRVVSPEEEAVQQVRRLAELQAERDRLRSERETLANLLNRVSTGRLAAGAPSPYRQLAAFPVFLSNRAVQDILASLTEQENARAKLLINRTEANADVQSIDQRIRELELQLYNMARNYLESLDSQISSSNTVLGRFGTDLEAIPAREVEFARLSRQEKLLDQIYSLLQTRLKEAEIREAAAPGDVRVIDSALVANEPFSPRPFRNLALGLALGVVVGVASAFGRAALDTRVRTREDVQAATGQMAVLGVIPRFAGPREASFRRKGLPLNAGVVVRHEPTSPAAEAYRALRTNIIFSGVSGAPQAMVITSAMPGEGKSTSSANLAVTLAQQGGRTLLVDADLRRGTQHHLFDVPQEPGLTQVLLGMATLEQAVQRIDLGEGALLDLLPAGTFPPNPAEILGSERMAALLAELRQRYDAIVFDAPPLNLVTDATVLAKGVDAAVLVTRTGITDRRALHHAAVQLQNVRAPVSGVVLNDVDLAGDRSYGYGYGYGYGYYSAARNGNGRADANRGNGKH